MTPQPANSLTNKSSTTPSSSSEPSPLVHEVDEDQQSSETTSPVPPAPLSQPTTNAGSSQNTSQLQLVKLNTSNSPTAINPNATNTSLSSNGLVQIIYQQLGSQPEVPKSEPVKLRLLLNDQGASTSPNSSLKRKISQVLNEKPSTDINNNASNSINTLADLAAVAVASASSSSSLPESTATKLVKLSF
jgi:hypothetical protein